MAPADLRTPAAKERHAEMASLGLRRRRLLAVPVVLALLALLAIGSAVSALVSL